MFGLRVKGLLQKLLQIQQFGKRNNMQRHLIQTLNLQYGS